jgi:hypothetical protein
MVTKPTGKREGRPRLPLRNDKDRYAIAYFAAQRRIAGKRNFSTRSIALALMQMQHGKVVVNTPGNIRAMHEGRPFKVWTGPGKYRGDEKGSAEHPRNKSVFHALADDFARKERKLGQLDAKTDDARWFLAMARAWMLCLDGNGARSFAMAWRLAESVDQLSYFKREMAPIFMRRCIFLPAPEFFPHD